jgi:hypothetical protein
MIVEVRYRGRSAVNFVAGGQALRLAPNLIREPVSFDGALADPVRFREAISALHDVVVSDLRFVPRDRQAYNDWKRQEAARLRELRKTEYEGLQQQVLNEQQMPSDLEQEYARSLGRYWRLRSQYSMRLRTRHPALWRMLTPCDPVITVADDVVFFECFSADQSSYGCLTCDREATFRDATSTSHLGTTNVDYSWQLYDQFQSLRSYRHTRLSVDPEGVEVATQQTSEYREEKIDLPEGWLRGFMQLQSAMTLPMRKVALSPQALYSIVAWYKRHKPAKSPRAMRFVLEPGKSPTVILEPWETSIESTGTVYTGAPCEPVRVWGARRLLALARALPLVESCDVYLLGTGLPSFWVVQLGGMRLTLGLSGWTANDWSRGSSLELLAPPGEAKSQLIERVMQQLARDRSATLEQLTRQLAANRADVAATLNHLARSGQVIFDLAAEVYRWRQIMPRAVGEQDLDRESPELAASRDLVRNAPIRVESQLEGPRGTTLYVGKVANQPVELVLNRDGTVTRGKCTCSHHHTSGIRRGPCRHLLALRLAVQGAASPSQSAADWYARLVNWRDN